MLVYQKSFTLSAVWASLKLLFFFPSGLVDEQQKVRTISALAIAALAEAATPYGIESFDSVLKPLWKGIRQHRGKVSMCLVAGILNSFYLHFLLLDLQPKDFQIFSKCF